MHCPECLIEDGVITVREYTHRTLLWCSCCNCKFSVGNGETRIFHTPTIDDIDYAANDWEFDTDTVSAYVGFSTFWFPLREYEAMVERQRIDSACKNKYGTTKPSPSELRGYWLR